MKIPEHIQEIIDKEKSGKRLRKAEKGLLKQFEDTKVGFKVGEKIVVRDGKYAVVGRVTKIETIKIPRDKQERWESGKLTFIHTNQNQSGFAYHFNKFNRKKYAVQSVYGRSY